MEGRVFYFQAEPTGNHIWHLWRGDLDRKEFKVVASMLPKWVWKRHQILSLGEPGQGSSQRLILTGSLFPFETRTHSPSLDPRSMARTSQGQHAFLKSRGCGQGSSCKTWWRKAFFFYLLKDHEAGMWRMLTSALLFCSLFDRTNHSPFPELHNANSGMADYWLPFPLTCFLAV